MGSNISIILTDEGYPVGAEISVCDISNPFINMNYQSDESALKSYLFTQEHCFSGMLCYRCMCYHDCVSSLLMLV